MPKLVLPTLPWSWPYLCVITARNSEPPKVVSPLYVENDPKTTDNGPKQPKTSEKVRNVRKRPKRQKSSNLFAAAEATEAAATRRARSDEKKGCAKICGNSFCYYFEGIHYSELLLQKLAQAIS